MGLLSGKAFRVLVKKNGPSRVKAYIKAGFSKKAALKETAKDIRKGRSFQTQDGADRMWAGSKPVDSGFYGHALISGHPVDKFYSNVSNPIKKGKC